MIQTNAGGVDLQPPSDSGELTVAMSETFDGMRIGREEWDKFILEANGDLYVTYDWCRIWWSHYGENRQLRLYVLRKGDKLVGLAPFFIESVRLGPVNLRIAKRVGADFALTVFALPLATDYAETAYRELILRLTEGEKCDAIWFGLMPGNDPTLSGLRKAFSSLRDIVTVGRDSGAAPHTLFHLPATFEAHIVALDKQQRQNYRRQLKLLNKDFNVESNIVRDSQHAKEAFATFKSAHDCQWQADGRLGHFGDWPRSELFNTELVDELARLGRFRMIRLSANGEVVTTQYAFVFGDRCYWRLPARATERRWDRYGLGVLGLMQLIEAMIGEGVHRLEAGLGHYDYKVRFGGQELQSSSVLVVSNRHRSILRARLFLRLSDLLHLVYYRIWFLKLAPRLRFSQGPLWRIWIRSRL